MSSFPLFLLSFSFVCGYWKSNPGPHMLDKCSSPELYPSYTMSFHLFFLLYVCGGVSLCVCICMCTCVVLYVFVLYICMCLCVDFRSHFSPFIQVPGIKLRSSSLAASTFTCKAILNHVFIFKWCSPVSTTATSDSYG